ncbi:MAG: hypothetical protein E6I98_06105 [Chloroflexi bacterium]|nr:MAG: hypothetical protein E6I98_06105 [Chloroflexota bacterium]
MTFLLPPVVAWAIAQVAKVALSSIRQRRLNRLVQDLVHMRGMQEMELRELLGHTPFEVLVGAVLGVAVGLIL